MDCLFTQHLFVNSVHRCQGTTSHYSIVVPAGALACQSDELFGISLVRFSAYRDWPGIPAGDNVVYFQTVVHGPMAVAISPGNPTNSQIALQLSNNTLGIKVTYDPPSNTLMFACSQSSTLTCSATLGATLGFPSGSSGTGSIAFQSATLRPPQLDQVVVRLEGVVAYADRGNLESAPGVMIPSTLLCAFPATGGPFQHVTYDNASEEFELIVDTNQINTLQFQLTDYMGHPLTYLGEHTIALRVRTLKPKNEEALELQRQLVGLSKDALTAQALGF